MIAAGRGPALLDPERGATLEGLQMRIEPGPVARQDRRDETVVGQLVPGRPGTLLAADQVGVQQRLDDRVRQPLTRLLPAQNLGPDAGKTDEPGAEPVADAPLQGLVGATEAGDECSHTMRSAVSR